VIVELGTHYGESYFGFCQCVEEHGVPAQCYAVDTWCGDEHSGFYGEEVFNDVDAYNRTYYSSFSSLIRTTFDDAAAQFGDGTIDLLHIDGLHTYEAVRRDFDRWFPKVRAGGVILLHDVVGRSPGFEVWRFWEELAARYPNFAFHHSWGLGVVRVPGSDVADNEFLSRLFAAAPHEQFQIRRYYVRLAESLELRARVAKARFTANELVRLKVYGFGNGGYDEKTSAELLVETKKWQRLSVPLPEGQGKGRIRIDPAEAPAVIDISAIEVRREADGELLWNGHDGAGFSGIEFAGDARLFQSGDQALCLSFGFDPQLILPVIPHCAPDEPLRLDIWVRIDTELREAGELLEAQREALEAQCEAGLSLERDLSAARIRIDAARRQIEEALAARGQLEQSASEAQARWTEENRKLESRLRELDGDLGDLRREYSAACRALAVEREQNSAIRHSWSWRITAPFRGAARLVTRGSE
jgi:hypothetical protein